MDLGALSEMRCLLSAHKWQWPRGGTDSGRRWEMFTWLSTLCMSELNMGKPLWSLHRLWGLGVWQGGGEKGFAAAAVLETHLSRKHLTTLLRQFKQNRDMMDLCNGGLKEHNSFLFWFPVLVHLRSLIPTAAAHHLPLSRAKFLSIGDKVSLVAGPRLCDALLGSHY